MKPAERARAKRNGEKLYSTGKPCPKGHVSVRYVSSGTCRKCVFINSAKKSERKNETRRKWYKTNIERLRAKGCEEAKLRRERYPEREKERCRLWKKSNPGIVNEINATRKARKRKATPVWADKEKIRGIYAKCPEGYQVDHIIPLCGKNICGLHVENNLQYLSPHENNIKHNSFDERMLV